MSFNRRLLIPSGSGGGFILPAAPPTLVISGPYDAAFSPSLTAKTQIHCHTTNSDGSYTPAAVVAAYLARGFDALMLSDHDKITAQPAGITTAILGNELSPTTQHIIAMNSTTYLRGTTTDAQTIIDAVAAGGGLTEIAHPKWIRGVSYAELAALTGYSGFEIHNAHCVTGASQNPVTYPGFAIDQWDQVLTNVRRNVWGYSVDDLHKYDSLHVQDIGRLRVFAASASVASLASSIEDGNFVADVSNDGVTPGYPDRDGDGVSLTCTGATAIEAYGVGGTLLDSASGTSLAYAWNGEERYVRLVAVGDYTEGFGTALDDRWAAIDGTWAAASGICSLTPDATLRRIVLRRHRDGDFDLEVDMRSSAESDARIGFMFNVLSSTYHYFLQVGGSAISSYSNKLAVGRLAGSNTSAPFAATPFSLVASTWYRCKFSYTAASGTMRAKLWVRGDTEPADWMITGVNTEWRNGAFGLRANRTADFDNLYIDGFRTYYQPITVDVV